MDLRNGSPRVILKCGCGPRDAVFPSRINDTFNCPDQQPRLQRQPACQGYCAEHGTIGVVGRPPLYTSDGRLGIAGYFGWTRAKPELHG